MKSTLINIVSFVSLMSFFVFPANALALEIKSCCILSQGAATKGCAQFRDDVQSTLTEEQQNTVRQFQSYSCQNLPYLLPDYTGHTATYIANNASNAGFCSTQSACQQPNVHNTDAQATCQGDGDCGGSIYKCQDNLCKITRGNGCIRGPVATGQSDPQVNCENGTVCKQIEGGGSKCFRPEDDPNESLSSSDAQSSSGAPFTAIKPILGVQIPGFEFTDAVEVDGEVVIPYLSQYINALYRYMTAVVVTVAIVMVTFGGFKYLLAATPMQVSDGKKIILDALIGMILVLGAYVILNTVNPTLISLQPITFDRVEPMQFEYIPPSAYSAATASSQFRAGQIPGSSSAAKQQAIELGRRLAREMGVDECFIAATIQHESGGNVNAIGHDENVIRVSTRARAAFERRGTTYLGNAITQRAKINGVTNPHATLNDDRFDPTKPDYGLDMDLTHGLGIGQITIGKAMANEPYCDQNGQRVYGWRSSAGNCYSVPDLLTMEGGVRAMIDISASKLRAARGNVPRAIALYIGYANSPTWETDPRTVNRMATYNACRGTQTTAPSTGNPVSAPIPNR